MTHCPTVPGLVVSVGPAAAVCHLAAAAFEFSARAPVVDVWSASACAEGDGSPASWAVPTTLSEFDAAVADGIEPEAVLAASCAASTPFRILDASLSGCPSTESIEVAAPGAPGDAETDAGLSVLHSWGPASGSFIDLEPLRCSDRRNLLPAPTCLSGHRSKLPGASCSGPFFDGGAS